MGSLSAAKNDTAPTATSRAFASISTAESNYRIKYEEATALSEVRSRRITAAAVVANEITFDHGVTIMPTPSTAFKNGTARKGKLATIGRLTARGTSRPCMALGPRLYDC